ncbi:MAG: sigma-70 family RNA polymerase sigma factor [Clostridia bacterium]|nr:sigma-70 family RNA polymerase sigma factor [Clostridia bacterium]
MALRDFEEKRLVKQARDGDVEAFERLIESVKLLVINTAYQYLKDYEDALDCSQEVFIKAYRNMASYRENSAFSTWIYQITKNQCIDMLRRNKTTNLSIEESMEDEDAPEIQLSAPESQQPENNAIRNRQIEAVRRAIDQLPDKLREVCVMRDIQELSYQEISELLDIPEGTVKSRLNSARIKLRKILEKQIELFD